MDIVMTVRVKVHASDRQFALSTARHTLQELIEEIRYLEETNNQENKLEARVIHGGQAKATIKEVTNEARDDHQSNS